MLREFTLQANEVKRLQVEGKWLIITQASAPIELTIGGTAPIIVDEKDRVHLRDHSTNDRAIRIRNTVDAVNTIELHTSDLLIDKRTAMDLKNAIEIAPDQIIGIDANNNIVQAIINHAIKIDSNQNTIKIDGDHNTVEVQRFNQTLNILPTVTFEEAPL